MADGPGARDSPATPETAPLREHPKNPRVHPIPGYLIPTAS
jgi:hypothetical protein